MQGLAGLWIAVFTGLLALFAAPINLFALIFGIQ